MSKVVILGAGESGVGAALLAKKQGLEVFVSDRGKIQDQFKAELIKNISLNMGLDMLHVFKIA